jgi:hypothetical protein
MLVARGKEKLKLSRRIEISDSWNAVRNQQQETDQHHA